MRERERRADARGDRNQQERPRECRANDEGRQRRQRVTYSLACGVYGKEKSKKKRPSLQQPSQLFLVLLSLSWRRQPPLNSPTSQFQSQLRYAYLQYVGVKGLTQHVKKESCTRGSTHVRCSGCSPVP